MTLSLTHWIEKRPEKKKEKDIQILKEVASYARENKETIYNIIVARDKQVPDNDHLYKLVGDEYEVRASFYRKLEGKGDWGYSGKVVNTAFDYALLSLWKEDRIRPSEIDTWRFNYGKRRGNVVWATSHSPHFDKGLRYVPGKKLPSYDESNPLWEEAEERKNYLSELGRANSSVDLLVATERYRSGKGDYRRSYYRKSNAV